MGRQTVRVWDEVGPGEVTGGEPGLVGAWPDIAGPWGSWRLQTKEGLIGLVFTGKWETFLGQLSCEWIMELWTSVQQR